MLELLHYKDKIQVINPKGNVAILTLWTPVATMLSFLQREHVDTSPETSAICAISTFYGDGLPQLLRNLVYNPTVTTIIQLGQDLSQSSKLLYNFVKLGTEPYGDDGLLKIKGTDRIIDSGVTQEMLEDLLVFNLGNRLTIEVASILNNALQPRYPRIQDRLEVPLVKIETTTFPSEINGHTVVRTNPVDAWKELVFRIMRFGQPTYCGDGKKRIELCNVKVVVKPQAGKVPFVIGGLEGTGLREQDIIAYQSTFLDGAEPLDVNYTYGNRIRSAFNFDMLEYVVGMLRADLTRRDCYFTLWHNFNDMEVDATEKSHPCLVSVWFRVIDNKLNVTATFRVHNCLSAWIKNFFGIVAIQQEVVQNLTKYKVEHGSIIIISNSITVDPAATDKMQLAEKILEKGYDNSDNVPKSSFKSDPNGYFTFDLDGKELVVGHMFNGQLLTEYRGKDAKSIERQLIQHQALSDIDHALYVGRELAKLETQKEES